MYWILMTLPSGSDRKVSVVIFKPSDGATCSLSHIADIASIIAMRALAASVCSSASSCSRLTTSPGRASSGIAPKIFLSRGSMRGSFVIFEAIIASLVQWRREQLTRVRGWPLAFSRDRRRCRRITSFLFRRKRPYHPLDPKKLGAILSGKSSARLQLLKQHKFLSGRTLHVPQERLSNALLCLRLLPLPQHRNLPIQPLRCSCGRPIS